MSDDPSNIPSNEHEGSESDSKEGVPQSQPDRASDGGVSQGDLDAKARQWLMGQLDRLGRDPDLVPHLSREEVSESVSADDMKAVKAYVISQSKNSTPRRLDRGPQPRNAAPSKRKVRFERFVQMIAVLVVLVAGIWGGGRVTAPDTQSLASVDALDREFALLSASPEVITKQGGMPGLADLRAGVQALREAAPSPLAPVPRYDAERASVAEESLESAYQAFRAAPPEQSVPSVLLGQSSTDLPDELDTARDLAAFAALLAAKASLMQDDPASAREWLQRVEPASPWSSTADPLLENLQSLSNGAPPSPN